MSKENLQIKLAQIRSKKNSVTLQVSSSQQKSQRLSLSIKLGLEKLEALKSEEEKVINLINSYDERQLQKKQARKEKKARRLAELETSTSTNPLV